MTPDDALEQICAAAGTRRSADAITAAIARLVTTGVLDPGRRLPTVRTMAKALAVSPTTVSDAWQALVASGVIETRGRLGSYVRDPASARVGERFWQIYPADADPGGLDLSEGVPDPELLPPITPALDHLREPTAPTSYLDDPVVPALEEHLRATWPFVPESMTVVDGALDALDRICSVVVRPGTTVVVETPGFPPLFDLLALARADVVGVPVDDEGMLPDELAAALGASVSAVFCQPRAHNPTGASMTDERAERLAGALADSEALIVEDDHSGIVGGTQLSSLGRWLPQRTLHIRSFSKSHGPDLRLAAIGGAGVPIAALVHRRQLGPAWSSRLLQTVLLAMLDDTETQRRVDDARSTYEQRRRAVTDELAAAGVDYTAGSGINVWVEVADERAALVDLAARGIGVAPGRPFVWDREETGHIRVTTGVIRERHREIGQTIAEAAGRRRFGRT